MTFSKTNLEVYEQLRYYYEYLYSGQMHRGK